MLGRIDRLQTAAATKPGDRYTRVSGAEPILRLAVLAEVRKRVM